MKPSLVLTSLLSLFPALASAENWSGAYIGAQLGYANQELSGGGINFTGEGAVYGILAGSRYAFGQIVMGGEVDYVAGSYDIVSVAPAATTEFESILRIKAQVGYDAGQFLPYATVGCAWLETGGGTNFDGLAFGLGGEYALTSKASAGIEVLWHDLDDETTGGFETEPVTISERVSYRF